MEKLSIYVVEDDESIRTMVVYALNGSGYEARGFPGGRSFYAAVNEKKPDLVLLDIMLPGEDGLSILKHLRAAPETSQMPVIMLTAKTAEMDKVRGLDLGADDYIPSRLAFWSCCRAFAPWHGEPWRAAKARRSTAHTAMTTAMFTWMRTDMLSRWTAKKCC